MRNRDASHSLTSRPPSHLPSPPLPPPPPPQLSLTSFPFATRPHVTNQHRGDVQLYRSGTLDELRVKCLEANAVLNHYGIFEQMDILCDTGPAEHPDSVSVTVKVVEKKRLNLKAGIYASQSGEGSMELSAGLNNALGYAEKLDFEIVAGNERSSTYTLAWNQPRWGWREGVARGGKRNRGPRDF